MIMIMIMIIMIMIMIISHLKWLRPKKVPGAISEMLFASSAISSSESWEEIYDHDDDP